MIFATTAKFFNSYRFHNYHDIIPNKDRFYIMPTFGFLSITGEWEIEGSARYDHNVKVLNDSGIGTYDSILSGIEYATEIGADVINMSLGGYMPAREKAAIRIYNEVLKLALEKGNTLPVTAAGNSNMSIASGRGGRHPAASPHSLAIRGYNKEKEVASYSNYGDNLHVVAQGHLSTVLSREMIIHI